MSVLSNWGDVMGIILLMSKQASMYTLYGNECKCHRSSNTSNETTKRYTPSAWFIHLLLYGCKVRKISLERHDNHLPVWNTAIILLFLIMMVTKMLPNRILKSRYRSIILCSVPSLNHPWKTSMMKLRISHLLNPQHTNNFLKNLVG